MTSFNYRLRSGKTDAPFNTPRFGFIDRSNQPNVNLSQIRQCVVQFDVPYDLDHTVLLYYKMTNFFQNHRRYVKSIDMNQLKGEHVSQSTISSGDCKPITVNTTANPTKIFYPCGLIANSVFNGASCGLGMRSCSLMRLLQIRLQT